MEGRLRTHTELVLELTRLLIVYRGYADLLILIFV